jgi:hypothetical protein
MVVAVLRVMIGESIVDVEMGAKLQKKKKNSLEIIALIP